MKKELNTIVSNSLYLYLVQGLNFILPILLLPYLIKTLSVESFGIYSFAFAFSQFLILFVDFGFNISATKSITEASGDKSLIRSIFWTVIFIKLSFFLLSIIFGTVVLLIYPPFSEYRDAVFCSYLMIFGTIFFPIWWFQGLNLFREMSIISVISKVMTYPLIFFFVKESHAVKEAVLIQSFSYILASLLTLCYFLWKEKSYFLNIELSNIGKRIGYEIKEAWPIFLSNSSINLYTNSITLMLGSFSTSYHVGLFGAVERIMRVVCTGILSPLNQACFPFLVNLRQRDFSEAKKFLKYILLIVLSLTLVIYGVYYLLRDFVYTYFLSEYTDGIYLLSIFLITIVPIAIGGVSGQLGLLALGGRPEKNTFSKIYAFTALFTFPFSLLCIYKFHVYGAVFSVMFIETIIGVALFVASLRFKLLSR